MPHSRLAPWLAAVCCSICQLAPAEEPQAPAVAGPLAAEESLAHFRLPEGLRIELVAAEPEVIDPVAIRFDEDGRLWVVEMGDYPNGPPPGEAPLSRIRILEDRDRDGRYETSSVFAEGLLFANGVQPWRQGAIVTLSGRIAYLADIDGDGRADLAETWYTGFAEDNPQLRVNHPRFALDNQVYVANGLRGGSVTDPRRPDEQPLPISGRDFRFDPIGGRCQAVSGHGQFGLTFDDFGNRFNCSNRNPLVHVVLADHYLARNPLLAVSAVASDVAAAGEASRVFPLGQAWTTSILHAGQFTAACGVEIYRGNTLPSEFAGNAFTCEPTGNLVHREIIEPAGATFTSKPAYKGAEFLASPDTWFRPVNLETGPDGALYVVDMYRAVIEHPEFVPDELKERPDLRWGTDRGRIYRIVAEPPPEQAEPRAPPRLSAASTGDLVALLEHPNAWWRETAARLLYQRQDRGAQGALERLVRAAADPRARVHALWTLEGLGCLSDALVALAIADRLPRVREQAVVLSEARLSRSPRLRAAVLDLASDTDPRLRFQVALSLGLSPGDDLVEPLAAIGLAGAGDPWTRLAVAASADRAGSLLKTILDRLATKNILAGEGELALVAQLAHLVGARREPDEIGALLQLAAGLPAGPNNDRLRLTAAAGMAGALRNRGGSLQTIVGQAQGNNSADGHLSRIFSRAAAIAQDTDAAPAARRQAVALLSHAGFDLATPVLIALVEAPTDSELELAAIRALAVHRHDSVREVLVANLPRRTPAARRAMLEALLADPPGAARILDELAAGRLRPAELDPLHTGRLLEHREQAIRQRAAELLAGPAPAERAEVLSRYRSAIEAGSDPRQGAEVFRKNCSTCHKIGSIGVDVGPSVADARTKTPEQLLLDILEPSRAIDNNYVAYSITTVDGKSLRGIIVSETASSVTLQEPEGKLVPLLRSDIDEVQSGGVSLMPEGLERNITPREMADLISFIKNWRYLDGQIPLPAGTAPASSR
ncbi:MAG: PVC-type heme-binding CxxCH protein [Pirellulales bacterium]